MDTLIQDCASFGSCLHPTWPGTASSTLSTRRKDDQFCCILQKRYWSPSLKSKANDMEPGILLKRQRKEILATAKQHGAYNVRVFGSVARGEAQPDSDLDLLVNLESGRSLLDLARLVRVLESQLGRKVDIVTEAGLRPRIRQEVLKEARPL